jgi:hypothetical protein
MLPRQTTRKGKQTDTHPRNNKINEEKQKKMQKETSEADSFRNMKVKIS